MNKVLNSIVHKEPIHKGWSEDKKFCVTTADGTKHLLRLSQLAKYESKKKLFSMMEQIAALDIPMCLPVEFGISNNFVYSIQSWINGQDLQTVLPLLPIYGVRWTTVWRLIYPCTDSHATI